MQPYIGKDFLIIASDISMLANWCVVKYFLVFQKRNLKPFYIFIVLLYDGQRNY